MAQTTCISVNGGAWTTSGTWEEDAADDGTPDGVSCPGGFPDAGDKAVISTHLVRVQNTDVTVGTVDIEANTSTGLVVQDGRTLTVEGDVEIISGNLATDFDGGFGNAPNPGILVIRGDFTNSGGSFFEDSATADGFGVLRFDSGGSQTVSGSFSGADRLGRVQIDGQGTSVVFDTNIETFNRLTIDRSNAVTSGAEPALTLNGSLIVGSNFINNGSFDANGQPVTVSGDLEGDFSAANGNGFADLTISGGQSALQATIDVDGDFTANSNVSLTSPLNLNGPGLAVFNNDILNFVGPGLISTTRTISLGGSGTQRIRGINFPGDVNITGSSGGVSVDGTSSIIQGETDITSSKQLSLNNDLLLEGNLDVRGDFTFADINRTLTFNGDASITGSGSFNIPSLESSSGTLTIESDVRVLNILNNGSGVVGADGTTVTFSDDDGSGSGTGNASSITSTGSAIVDFASVTADNANGVTFNSPVNVRGELTLSQATTTTNGNLTVASSRNAAGNAADGGIVANGGSISHSVGDTAERFISDNTDSQSANDVGSIGTLGNDAGYRMIATPFAGTINAGDLVRVSPGSPSPGSGDTDLSLVDNPPFGLDGGSNTENSMIFRYDDASQSYVSPFDDGLSNDREFDLEFGRGYLLFFFDDTEDPIEDGTGLTYDVDPGKTDGTVTAAPSPVNTQQTVTGVNLQGNTTDFYLLGNPYPSGYNLKSLEVGGASISGGSTDFSTVVEIIPAGGDGSNTTGNLITIDLSTATDAQATVAPWQGFFLRQTSSNTGNVAVDFPTAGVTGSTTNRFLEKSLSGAKSTNPQMFVSLAQKTETNGRGGPGQTQIARGGLDLEFRSDETVAQGLDTYDSPRILLPTTAMARDGSTIGLETAILASEGTRADGSGIFLKKDARPTPSSFPVSYDVTFDCANLKTSSADFIIDLASTANLPDDWIVLVRDTEKTTDNESILYAGSNTDFTGSESPYTFNVSSSACGSSVSTSKSGGSASRSLVYDGSLTGASAKAATGSRFQIVIETDATIPVELNGFTGSVDGKDVRLEWKTASETDNAGFQVQRRVEGQFTDVSNAFIEGAGTTSDVRSYSYRVENLPVGTHTFRLKQVDVDGAATYSKELDVRVNLAGNYELNAYPNPFRNRATVSVAVKEAQPVTVEVYNTLGQRVQVLYDNVLAAEDQRNLEFDATNLASGLYIVRMRGESFSTTQTITVVR